MLRAPRPGCGTPEEGTVEGDSHFPRSAGFSSFVVTQDVVGFPGCKCTLLAHILLFVCQNLQVFLLRVLSILITQPVFMFEIALTQMQVLAFDLVQLHVLGIGQLFKAIKVPLEGISFQCC